MLETTEYKRILFSGVTATTERETPSGKTLNTETRFARYLLGNPLVEFGGVFGHIVRLTVYVTIPITNEVRTAVTDTT